MTVVFRLRRGPVSGKPELPAMTETGTKQSSTSARIGSALLTVLAVVAIFFIWPTHLGGGTRYVVVSGTSMQPTYNPGDVLVARDTGPPRVGDAVVISVPEGTAAGILVVHRVIAIDAEGLITTQGDNRDTPDQWALTADDIVGQPVLRVPKGGALIALIQQKWFISALVGLLVVIFFWPTIEEDEPTETADEERAGMKRGDDFRSALATAHLAEPVAAETDAEPTIIRTVERQPDLTHELPLLTPFGHDFDYRFDDEGENLSPANQMSGELVEDEDDDNAADDERQPAGDDAGESDTNRTVTGSVNAQQSN